MIEKLSVVTIKTKLVLKDSSLFLDHTAVTTNCARTHTTETLGVKIVSLVFFRDHKKKFEESFQEFRKNVILRLFTGILADYLGNFFPNFLAIISSVLTPNCRVFNLLFFDEVKRFLFNS